jgi:hypothetical protein
MRSTWKKILFSEIDISTLAFFRIAFGFLMLISTVRFWANGWVQSQLIDPKHYFHYWGFEWISPLSAAGIHSIYALMVLSTIAILLGYFYRYATVLFFILFTYTELIDITNYLNHYYFISLVALIMIFVPANRAFSLDCVRNPNLKLDTVPRWTVEIIRFQLAIVYFYAGIAKINPDWLFDAMPMSIWLQAKSDWPLVGSLFTEKWVAFAFSWAGCIYDLLIPFLLYNTKTRRLAFVLVVIFHALTRMLFPIGMFPFIMITATLTFFSSDWHRKILHKLNSFIYPNFSTGLPEENLTVKTAFRGRNKFISSLIFVFFAFQIIFPFRYAMYPGKLFWTEQGFRFSWRVMLMEKSGAAFFYVQETDSDRKYEINNSDFLTAQQEKMMATQPDLILQYARIIEEEAINRGWKDPKVTAEVYVSLNGLRSKPFIDPTVDLTELEDSFSHKTWILPFEDE